MMLQSNVVIPFTKMVKMGAILTKALRTSHPWLRVYILKPQTNCQGVGCWQIKQLLFLFYTVPTGLVSLQWVSCTTPLEISANLGIFRVLLQPCTPIYASSSWNLLLPFVPFQTGTTLHPHSLCDVGNIPSLLPFFLTLQFCCNR